MPFREAREINIESSIYLLNFYNNLLTNKYKKQ